MKLTVRDSKTGEVVFHVDTTEDVARDLSGRPVASRVDFRSADMDRKVAMAARWMARGERQVLLDLGPADVQQPATRAEFGIPQLDCIADIVSPVTMVKHDRGYWFQESALDAIKPVNADIGADGTPATLTPGYSPVAFTTSGYALATQLPYDVINNADFDVRKRATRRLCEALRLSRELRAASLLTTAGSFASGNQITPVAKWSAATGNPAPLTDLFAALKASVIPADTLILSENVAPYFHYSPYQGTAYSTGAQIRDYVQGGGRLPRILMPTAKYSVSAPANAATPQYVWATGTTGWNVPLVRVGSDPETDTLTCRTFRWLGDESVRDGAIKDGVLVREFDEPTTRSRWIVVAHNDAEVIESNVVGSVIAAVS